MARRQEPRRPTVTNDEQSQRVVSATRATPPRTPRGLRHPPYRRSRMPEQLRVLDSIDQGARIALRFARLKDLPEHPLFHQIHAKLAQGEPILHVVLWVQSVVGPDDPYSAENMPMKTLHSRLRRYSMLLPATARIPRSYLDAAMKGVVPEIDVVAELGKTIAYQKRRIGNFAEREETLARIAGPSEQQRKEVHELSELLTKMRDTQIALGVVAGILPTQVSMSQTNVNVGLESGSEALGTDPFTKFLLEHPQSIPAVMSGLDRVIAEHVVIDGTATEIDND